MESVCQVAL
uniref:Uncharacterized protein n=1 Tax=Anguilla anguilla TaxID=7936 RepID=A0A0E9PY14_ANGAN